MSKRMSDERLTEIRTTIFPCVESVPFREVLQALKAERERVEELERVLVEVRRHDEHTAGILKVAEKEYQHQISELQRKYERLVMDFAGCMDTAAEDIEDWGAYASDYFQQKHGMKTELQRYRNKANELRTLLENDDE